MIIPYDLTCEYENNPIGVDVPAPRLSWKCRSSERGARQTAYQIQVVADPNESDASIWDSGKVESDASIHIPFGGDELEPGKRCYWAVRLWNEHDESSGWSEFAFWEMGLIDHGNWSAEWITDDSDEEDTAQNPPPMFRRSFAVQGKVKSAKLYITSLGVYEARLNGRVVGDAVLAPGWTTYDHRIQYQTFDVTELLLEGENVVAATVGDGWFRGFLAFAGQRDVYGKRLALLAQLEIAYADGRRELVSTDSTWRASTGPIQMADLYMGETYDARLEQPGWDSPGFSDKEWDKVRILDHRKDIVVAQSGPVVKRQERITPAEIIRSPKGEIIYDFGQNMVGWVRLEIRAPEGTTVTLRHGEVLDQEGNLYLENLRSAKQTVTYICKGTEDAEIYEPHFTFQGFRYVSIEGPSEELPLSALTGVVLNSDMPVTGTFECSNPLINQLQHNIMWGQKGNYLDVPTDCPQRDERLGWTGDAQVFIRTACFNMGVAGFFTKWLRDLSADQWANGNVPFVSPDVLGRNPHPFFGSSGGAGSAAWGDAAVICPWTIYLCYGDTRLLEEQYSGMAGWVDYIAEQAGESKLWTTGFHFGDWLDYRGPADLMPMPVTNNELIATAFYAFSAGIVSKAAKALGNDGDAQKYAELSNRVKNAFCDEFVTAGGRVGPDTQTGYVLALHFDLLPEHLRQSAADRLAELVKKAGYHLTTGFVGTPYLCHTLSRFGYIDVAYELLNQESFPSWLYPVKKGATTIWERWDGIKPDGSFQDVGMNSFNHYAYGAIGEWLYRVVAGIDIDQDSAGYKHVIIEPRPGGGITKASATLESPYGQVVSKWITTENEFKLTVTVPPNTRGTITIPATADNPVTEHGKPVVVGNGIERLEYIDETAKIDVTAGTYEFVSEAITREDVMAAAKHIAGRLDVYSALSDILADEGAKAVLVDAIGAAFLEAKELGMVMGYSLVRLAEFAPGLLTQEKLDSIDSALRDL